MQAIMSQKDFALVHLAEEFVALHLSGYHVDTLVAVLLCLANVKSPKAEARISKAVLDLTRRALQPTEMKAYPWEDV